VRKKLEAIDMGTTTLIIIFSLILGGAVGIAVMIFLGNQKTARLRMRFGPEYARAVQESRSRRHGKAGLQEGEKRASSD
jgi:hypothetical protein